MFKDNPYNSYQIDLPNNAVSFDAESFDSFIRGQGVEFIHYSSMRCPVGLGDPDDIRQVHEHHEACSNGRLYMKEGTVTCGFLGNGGDNRFIDAGLLDGSSVNVVLPRFYDDRPEESVEVSIYDRMYLKEEAITVVTDSTIAAHISGKDRLPFPAVRVVHLVDSRGVSYKQDTDFAVVKGQIHWLGQNQPGVDPKTGKGTVYSVRYSYRPFWYVKSMPHEVRVAQTEDDYGNRAVQRFPQQAILQREYHFEKSQRDSQASDPEGRQKPGPADGMFGPR